MTGRGGYEDRENRCRGRPFPNGLRRVPRFASASVMRAKEGVTILASVARGRSRNRRRHTAGAPLSMEARLFLEVSGIAC